MDYFGTSKARVRSIAASVVLKGPVIQAYLIQSMLISQKAQKGRF